MAAGAVLPLKPLERKHLLWRARQMGVEDSVCLTGFVHDTTLLRLHQGSDLFVFPSLYEGYGLPVAEALACGTPVLAADASSLPEIVGPDALFDATRPAAMAAAIERGLTDDGFRRRLLAAAGRAPSSWDEVARATLGVYDRILAGDLRPPARPAVQARRRRVAFAAALGPDGGDSAAWDRAVLVGLEAHPDLEVRAFADRRADGDFETAAFADRPADEPRPSRRPLGSGAGNGGGPIHPLAALEAVEELDGRFDAVVYVVADDADHAGCLSALRRRQDGVVVARDVGLADLYGHAARTGGLPDRLAGTIAAAYGDAVLPGVGAGESLAPDEARRLGVLLTRDVLRHCRGLVVTRPSDAALADLDAAPADRAKIVLAATDPQAVAGAAYEFVTRLAAPSGEAGEPPEPL